MVRERIAVIGAGVAGVAASHLLQGRYDVTLFERNDYVGGHTNTIVIEGGADAWLAVDTGFIVLNQRTYPLFNRLLLEWGVSLRDSDMSFGFYDESTGFQYAGTGVGGLFAQPMNALSPSFLKMLWDIRRFGIVGARALEDNLPPETTLGDFLAQHRFSARVINDYILPLGAAIWSTAPGRMVEYPAASILGFFNNHGLLNLADAPIWQTVEGGSSQYIKAFLRGFTGNVRLSCPVNGVERNDEGVRVCYSGGEERFDRALMACHADESLALLKDPSPDEARLLGAWRYSKNHTVLHTDASVMPTRKRAWASWNYVRERDGGDHERAALTYHMNRLQGLKTQIQYFVTLNVTRVIAPQSIIREIEYTHPQYDLAALRSQQELPRLNGARNTYFCGSYFGYGFHEDAVRSAVEAARNLGVEW